MTVKLTTKRKENMAEENVVTSHAFDHAEVSERFTTFLASAKTKENFKQVADYQLKRIENPENVSEWSLDPVNCLTTLVVYMATKGKQKNTNEFLVKGLIDTPQEWFAFIDIGMAEWDRVLKVLAEQEKAG